MKMRNEKSGYFCQTNPSNHSLFIFMQNLNQLQEVFDNYLSNNDFSGRPRALYEPANYILSLGGKRLRPAILLAAHHLFKDDVEKSLPAAFAVEVFHNFSLVHDDIMDAAPLRRGQPTVHQKFSQNAGILSGDVMLVKAYEFLLKSDSHRNLELLKRFTKMAVQVCEGQQMDMDFESKASVTIPEYLEMVKLKTAVLVATALEIGALIGEASYQDAQLLYDFGLNLGIAFQLQDDILDAFGDPIKFGKKPGGDIVQNKKTYLYLKALEIAPAETAAKLSAYYSDSKMVEEKKINEVLQIFLDMGVREEAASEMRSYWEASMNSLSQVGVAAERKILLEKFAADLMQRDY